MNNVVDEVLASSPRYNIYDANGNLVYANAQIDLSTQVTTAGTPLNKALFDSIRDDLNTRLLISSKATQSEAQQGTNNTHYSTPLRVKEQLQYLTKTGSKTSTTSSSAQTSTIYSSSGNISGAKRVIISGSLTSNGSGSYPSILNINGTGFRGDETFNVSSYTTSITSTQIATRYTEDTKQSYRIELDLNAKTFNFQMYFSPNYTSQSTFQMKSGTGTFETLTDVSVTLRGNGNSKTASTSYTITYMY